jgi:hypothetical protein
MGPKKAKQVGKVVKKKSAVAKATKPPLMKSLRSRKVVVEAEEVPQAVKVAKKRGKKDPKGSIDATLGVEVEGGSLPDLSATVKRKRGEKSKSKEKEAKLMRAMEAFVKTILAADPSSEEDEKGESDDEEEEEEEEKEEEEEEEEEEEKEGKRGKRKLRAATLLALKRSEKELLDKANKEKDEVKKLLCAGGEVVDDSGSWKQLVKKSTVSEVLEKLELVHKEEDLKKMLRVE